MLGWKKRWEQPVGDVSGTEYPGCPEFHPEWKRVEEGQRHSPCIWRPHFGPASIPRGGGTDDQTLRSHLEPRSDWFSLASRNVQRALFLHQAQHDATNWSVRWWWHVCPARHYFAVRSWDWRWTAGPLSSFHSPSPAVWSFDRSPASSSPSLPEVLTQTGRWWPGEFRRRECRSNLPPMSLQFLCSHGSK